MSLFGDLDIASAADNPFAIPDDTYEAYVFEVKVGKTNPKDGKQPQVGMTINYKIASGDHEDKMISEWKRIPTKAELESADKKTKQDADRAASFLKARMLDLGIPGDKINSVESEDLVGIHCSVTTRTVNGYSNASKVALWEGDSANSDPFKM